MNKKIVVGGAGLLALFFLTNKDEGKKKPPSKIIYIDATDNAPRDLTVSDGTPGATTAVIDGWMNKL